MNIFKKHKEKKLKLIQPEVEKWLIEMNLLTIDQMGKRDYKMGASNVKREI